MAGSEDMPWRLRVALGLAVLAAAAHVIGPMLPVVRPPQAPGFVSLPMLAVLAILPVAAAFVAVARGRDAVASGILGVVAVFIPGQLVSDLQLASDGSASARPELLVPVSLQPLSPGPGLWLLVVGHLLAAAAGVFALMAYPAAPDSPFGETGDSAMTRAAWQSRFTMALSLGVVAAMALFVVEPFFSDSLYIPGRSVLEQPPLALTGGVLVAVAAAIAPTLTAVLPDPDRAWGGRIGAAIGLLAVALPALVAGVVMAGLHPSWGPWVVVVVAALLIVTARSQPLVADGDPAELSLPEQNRLHAAAGVLGVITGVAALIAAFSSQIILPEFLPQVEVTNQKLLFPVALLVLVLGAALLVPRVAAAVRPAFAVVLVTVPLAAASTLDTVLAAMQIDSVRVGVGAWLAGLSVLIAAAAAGCAGAAGGVERDDVDISEHRFRPVIFTVAMVGFVLTFLAFGVPVLRSSSYVAPGLWSNFRFASWGLILALIAVAVAVAIAALARPARATALLIGAAGVLAVHLLELPLSAMHSADTEIGPGAMFAVAGIVILLIAAGLSGWTRTKAPAR